MKKGKGMGCLFIIVALIFVGVVLFRFVLGSNSVLDTENSDYSQVYFDDLADDLAKGVDSAKSKYLDQKITIVGSFDKEAKIDGVSEDCIVLSDDDEDNNASIWAICHLRTDDQREEAEEFSEGDHVVVRGTVTDINETTFFIDVDDID